MKYIVFIQSVSGAELDIGEILNQTVNEYHRRPNVSSDLVYASDLKTLETIIDNLVILNPLPEEVILVIDAHSNQEEIYFREKSNNNLKGYKDSAKWSRLQKTLD